MGRRERKGRVVGVEGAMKEGRRRRRIVQKDEVDA